MKPIEVKVRVVKSSVFGNWADQFGYSLAQSILPFVVRISFLTPNIITVMAFIFCIVGSASLFLNYSFHNAVSAILLVLAYFGDQLDGQVARERNLSSRIGDFMDKVFDILKIFLIAFSLALACYLKTGNAVYIFLGFIACFCFNLRYYIKLEVVAAQFSKDNEYLKKSAKYQNEIEEKQINLYMKENKSLKEILKTFWLKHRIIFLTDEAEFALFTAAAALFGKIELILWYFTISQILIVLWRIFERAYQYQTESKDLIGFIRK